MTLIDPKRPYLLLAASALLLAPPKLDPVHMRYHETGDEWRGRDLVTTFADGGETNMTLVTWAAYPAGTNNTLRSLIPLGFFSAYPARATSEGGAPLPDILEKPYAYEVEYLQSSGTQYIDTEVNATSGLSFKVRAALKNVNFINSSVIAGSGISGVPGVNVRVLIHDFGYSRVGTHGKVVVVQQGGYFDTPYINVDTEFHTYGISPSGLSIDTNTYPPSPLTASNLSIFLFAQNNNGNLIPASIKVTMFQAAESGVLVRDLIPVVDYAGVACMYDKVSGRFFYNAGTGQFTAGPRVFADEASVPFGEKWTLPLTNGTWAANCLPPVYTNGTVEAKIGGNWPYGVWTVNVETDSALTLTVAGAEKFVAASNGVTQVFNIMGEDGSRAVTVAASRPNATVRLGIAANRAVEFFTNYASDGIGHFNEDLFKPVAISNAWRMVAVRMAVTNGVATSQVAVFGDYDTEVRDTHSKAMDFPREGFAKDARLAIRGMTFGDTTWPIWTWGAKAFDRWLTDAELERIRDKDLAEMTRRGMERTVQ